MAHDAAQHGTSRSRILFFSAYPGFTGSHRMTLQLAAACRNAGHDVTVAAPAKWEIIDRAVVEGISVATIEAPQELLEFGKTLLKKNLPGRITFALKTLLPYAIRARAFLRAGKIDIVYAAQERAVLQIGLAARFAGIPVLWHIQSGLTSGQNSIHKAARKLSSRIVCVSHAVAEDVAQTLCLDSATPLRVIHNALPDSHPHPEIQTAPNQEPPFRILFAGSVVPEKGLHHLITAVAGLSPASGGNAVHLRIAGPAGDAGYLRFLETRVRDEGLERHVEFLGFRDDVPRLMVESDVIVCPSIEQERIRNDFGDWDVNWKEGFCLVALEAMRAAKPVIASDSYGLREVVSDGESGIRVPPGDAPALTSAIQELMTNPERRCSLGLAGRRLFDEQFSLERMTGRFLREFRSIGPQGRALA